MEPPQLVGNGGIRVRWETHRTGITWLVQELSPLVCQYTAGRDKEFLDLILFDTQNWKSRNLEIIKDCWNSVVISLLSLLPQVYIGSYSPSSIWVFPAPKYSELVERSLQTGQYGQDCIRGPRRSDIRPDYIPSNRSNIASRIIPWQGLHIKTEGSYRNRAFCSACKPGIVLRLCTLKSKASDVGNQKSSWWG